MRIGGVFFLFHQPAGCATLDARCAAATKWPAWGCVNAVAGAREVRNSSQVRQPRESGRETHVEKRYLPSRP